MQSDSATKPWRHLALGVRRRREPPRAPAAPRAGSTRPPCRPRRGFEAAHNAARGADRRRSALNPSRNRRLGGAVRGEPALLLPLAFVASGCCTPHHTPRGRLSPRPPGPAPSARRATRRRGTEAPLPCRPSAAAAPPRAPLCSSAAEKSRQPLGNAAATAPKGLPQGPTAPSSARVPRREHLGLWWARRAAVGVPPPRDVGPTSGF